MMRHFVRQEQIIVSYKECPQKYVTVRTIYNICDSKSLNCSCHSFDFPPPCSMCVSFADYIHIPAKGEFFVLR